MTNFLAKTHPVLEQVPINGNVTNIVAKQTYSEELEYVITYTVPKNNFHNYENYKYTSSSNPSYNYTSSSNPSYNYYYPHSFVSNQTYPTNDLPILSQEEMSFAKDLGIDPFSFNIKSLMTLLKDPEKRKKFIRIVNLIEFR